MLSHPRLLTSVPPCRDDLSPCDTPDESGSYTSCIRWQPGEEFRWALLPEKVYALDSATGACRRVVSRAEEEKERGVEEARLSCGSQRENQPTYG